jgi:hypothetical protein
VNLKVTMSDFSPMQHQTRRNNRHNGVMNAKVTLDLIIVDVPEGHPILTVSAPLDVVSL